MLLNVLFRIIMQKSKLMRTVLFLWKKRSHFRIFEYSLSQFLIKLKITTTKVNFLKKVCIKCLKTAIINKFFINFKCYFKCQGRIDVSQRIHANKTRESKEWGICHYWYFLDKGFKF